MTTSQVSTDRIEKKTLLRAPRAKVWRALTDSSEFGTWFRAKLEGPFQAGKHTRGKITYPGYEHVTFDVLVERIEPERLFALRWHPYNVDAKVDYSKEPMTLVEFRLDDAPEGTLLTVVESGFDKIPAARRDEAFRMNSEGWGVQMENVRRHVAGWALAAAEVRDAAPLFAALGDETRLRLLARLSTHGPDSIVGLSARAEVTRQAITKHLTVLSRAGLVHDEWRGRERIWRLEPQRLDEAREHIQRISSLWDDALGRLAKHVEE